MKWRAFAAFLQKSSLNKCTQIRVSFTLLVFMFVCMSFTMELQQKYRMIIPYRLQKSTSPVTGFVISSFGCVQYATGFPSAFPLYLRFIA